MPRWYLASLVVANLALLLPDLSPFRVAGALLLIGLLPGLSWANRLPAASPALLRWTIAAALSYVITTLTTLLLHYLPGPVHAWQVLAALDALALLPFLINRIKAAAAPKPGDSAAAPLTRSAAPLLLILLIALALRTANLHYSEFQGDEALAMISAAEALEGHADALFLRAKGPGEVLLPMALWRLTGPINEPVARLPFTVAALLAIVTIYQLGHTIGGRRVGWLAAGFFACHGFMVAFGRIVQYQALVVWMSALALLMTIHWRKTGQQRFAVLGGLFLGTGLLAHYDAILVTPAIAWLFVAGPTDRGTPGVGSRLAALFKPALFMLTACLLTALSFYLPFTLDPQANRTGAYVSGRIGTELRNNLPDFFHFNTFYSSSYYHILTGLLVLGVLAWFVWQAHRRLRWVSALIVIAILAVVVSPNLLAGSTLNLAALPFLLLFAGAFLAAPGGSKLSAAPPTDTRFLNQTVIAWLAVPFLGYNFVVALGLTHIYTIVPAWSLLAALGWHYFFDPPPAHSAPIPGQTRFPSLISNVLLGLFLILSTLFLWNAFIRHDIEYRQDYPAGNLRLFWTPYDAPPKAGFFGFAHRAGWKAVGQKIVTGQLAGDYGSNEEPDVTTWYTRGAPRACDPRPEFYFLADDLIDPVDVPHEIINTDYAQIGTVTMPNQKQMQLMQQMPGALTIGELNDAALAREFDRTATPAAFARSGRGSVPVEANFGNLVQLIGYDLDPRRAYPGGRLPVTLYWQALTPIPDGYQVFTHLESDTGPVAQADGVPVCWSYPTDLWRPGQIIADQHTIAIPAGAPPGDYPLQVGLYLPGTFARLDVLDEAGNPAGTGVTLTVITIGD